MVFNMAYMKMALAFVTLEILPEGWRLCVIKICHSFFHPCQHRLLELYYLIGGIGLLSPLTINEEGYNGIIIWVSFENIKG